jgi:putative chitinase
MQTNLADDLRALGPRAKTDLLAKLAACAPEILKSYNIDTELREAHFWAQAAHETGGFRYMFEIWGPTDVQKRYEGRKDLGNTKEGDGFKYRGRGIFQLTGRANYKSMSEKLGIDLLEHPDKAAEPENALRIACEYWKSRKLNALADADDVVAITKKINGGTNGIQDRKACLLTAKKMWHDNYETDAPLPAAKTMSVSKQGNAALLTAGLGGLGAAKEITAQVQDASDLFTKVMSLMTDTNFLIMLAFVGTGAAIWYWRKKHLEEHGV